MFRNPDKPVSQFIRLANNGQVDILSNYRRPANILYTTVIIRQIYVLNGAVVSAERPAPFLEMAQINRPEII